jgi:hypothetical protein
VRLGFRPACGGCLVRERQSSHRVRDSGIHGGTKAREINVGELRVLGMVYPVGNPEFNEKPP